MNEKIICEERADEGIRLFKDGCCGTIRTIEAGGDKRVIEVKQIGNVMPGTNRENPNQGRVYDKEGLAPTISCMGGGNLQPMIVASRGRNPDNPSDRTPGNYVEQRLEPNSEGICNTLTSVQKDNLVLEPAILTPKRTEYGKAIRKDYESGKIQESRHNMTELQPREDGISNTLTTVQKDNLVLEPKLVGGIGEKDWGKQWRQGNRVYDSEAVAMAITAQPLGNTGGYSYLYKTDYRIRKLTPLECWRLMAFTDEDFHKAEKVNSNTQLYKQAGNSIVVKVLEGIFKQML